MIEILKCGCGGNGVLTQKIRYADYWFVFCDKCKIKTAEYLNEEQALVAFKNATRVDVEIEYKEICRKLRIERVNRKLGLGGERLEDLLIRHIEKLEAEIKK